MKADSPLTKSIALAVSSPEHHGENTLSQPAGRKTARARRDKWKRTFANRKALFSYQFSLLPLSPLSSHPSLAQPQPLSPCAENAHQPAHLPQVSELSQGQGLHLIVFSAARSPLMNVC